MAVITKVAAIFDAEHGCKALKGFHFRFTGQKRRGFSAQSLKTPERANTGVERKRLFQQFFNE